MVQPRSAPALNVMVSPSQVELARLVASVGEQDRAAFKTLYGMTAPKLLGVVLRMVRDRALAEEVLQDVYLRVWQSASTYSAAAGQPMTWLAAIARHRAIDRLRQRREVLLGDDETGADWIAGVPDPRSLETEFLSRDALGGCLERLDDLQRDCIVLAYCHGHSREELATRFDRPVNTIKTWLHRSLASLRACLDETS